MTQADFNFINTCQKILNEGTSDKGFFVRPKWPDGTPAHTIKLANVINEYDIAKEFPILTIRKVPLKSAIDELLWIWQKKSNKLEELNSHIWDAWDIGDGTIGYSYGAVLAKKHNYSEGTMDQVDRILWCLKNNPMDRRMIVDMFDQDMFTQTKLPPCCHHVNLVVTGDKLNMLLKQRSQDMGVANGWNVAQYAILLHMLAQVSNLKVGKLTHVIADCHIYDRHIPLIQELIANNASNDFKAPTLKMNSAINNFYDFKVDDFSLENYNFNSFNKKFEVAE